jgi:hypothetical protein
MPYNDQFEENIRRRFANARMEPSPDLWKKLETQLPTQTRKRVIPFWKSMGLLAIAATLALLAYSAIAPPVSGTVAIPEDQIAQNNQPEIPLVSEHTLVPEDRIAVEDEPQKLLDKVADDPKKIIPGNKTYLEVQSHAKSEEHILGPVMHNPMKHYVKVKLPVLSRVSPEAASFSVNTPIPELSIPETQFGINNMAFRDDDKSKRKGLFAFFAQGDTRRSGLGKEEVAFVSGVRPTGVQGGYNLIGVDLPVQKNVYPQWVSSATVGAELFLGENISMHTGLGVSRFTQSAPFTTNSNARYLDAVESLEFSNAIDPVLIPEYQQVNANQLEHTALNIPLGFSLYAGNNKRAVALKAELAYQPVISSTYNTLNRASYDLEALAATGQANLAQNQVENDLLNPHAIRANLGIRLEHRLGKRIQLFGGPSLSYNVSPAYTSSKPDFDQNNLGLGFEMGLKWQQSR